MSHFFSSRGSSTWHSLDDIVQSALADVISADALFQLRQAEAWTQFSDNIRSLSSNPLLQTIDLSVGFGRLENLAMQEVTITLDLEVYHESLWAKTWWGCLSIFGVKKETQGDKVYRLSKPSSGSGNRLELALKLKRDQYGQWQVNNQPVTATAEHTTTKHATTEQPLQ